jgi:hypothetical protein
LKPTVPLKETVWNVRQAGKGFYSLFAPGGFG